MASVHTLVETLKAIIPLFGLIAIGYAAKKGKLLSVEDAAILNRFVVDIAFPAFIVDAFLTHQLLRVYAGLPLVLWLGTLAAVLTVLAVGKILRMQPKTIGAAMLVSAFGNTGFLGYPITVAMFPPKEGLLTASVIIDQLGMSMLLYPGAVIIASFFGRAGGDSVKHELAKFARSPLLVAFVVSLILKAIPSQFIPKQHEVVAAGHLILATLHLVGSATIPVVLVAIGLLLRPSTLRNHVSRIVMVAGLKLAVFPVVGWATARYILGVRGHLLEVCVLESAMPPSAAATVLAGRYDMDGELAVAAFFAATVLSALTIPLALTLLR